MGRVNQSLKQRVPVAPQNGFKTMGRGNRPKQRLPVAPQNDSKTHGQSQLKSETESTSGTTK